LLCALYSQAPGLHRRILLQDASLQETGTAVTAIPTTNPLDDTATAATAATAALATAATSPYAPDAPDASVGEALPPVTASAADLQGQVDGTGVSRQSTRRTRPTVLTVPGNGVGPAAAVMPGERP
jgi:hypothetical protein